MEVKLNTICIAGWLLFLGSMPAAARNHDTPLIAALRQQAEQTAIAAQKHLADQNEFISALQTYNNHQSETSAGAEASLYREYEALLARYTALITWFWPVNPGDKDPNLPLVKITTEDVTADMVKADYRTMAYDYLEVLKNYSTGVNYSMPPEPPPLPPLQANDTDAQKMAKIEKTLDPARQASLASRSLSKQVIGTGWGPDVPLGGLHTQPEQPAQNSGQWCQVGSDGALVPCGQ
jgi:hypothetical protein